MPQVVLLDFAPDHAASYNALVEVIRRNLLLADWCDDAHNEVRDVNVIVTTDDMFFAASPEL
jgi:hypothetical protein